MGMNPEWKKKWLDALRSGEYKQTRGMLRRCEEDTGQIGFCCLGVLCDLVQKEGIGRWEENSAWFVVRDAESRGLVPGPVMALVGWNQFNGELGVTEVRQTKLIHMNDDEKATFDQIADFIEENL